MLKKEIIIELDFNWRATYASWVESEEGDLRGIRKRHIDSNPT